MIKYHHLDAETDFFCGLLELQYGNAQIKKLQKLASEISWAQGWPTEKKAFWNAEAFLWKQKISRQKRELIKNEILLFLSEKKESKAIRNNAVNIKSREEVKIKSRREADNLDLGCGAYSYLPSVGFDCSEEMLKLNEQCVQKIVGDIEKPLPFASAEFSSVTAIFVLNYIQNYFLLFSEIFRILKPAGKLVAVLSEKGVNDWQGQKEINHFLPKKWKNIFQENGFSVEMKANESLLFFLCKKKEK